MPIEKFVPFTSISLIWGFFGQLVYDTPSFLFIPVILFERGLVMVRVFGLNRFDIKDVPFGHAMS